MWNCPGCTFANDEFKQKCELCETQRPIPVQRKTWQCNQCTLLNEHGTTICLLCGAIHRPIPPPRFITFIPSEEEKKELEVVTLNQDNPLQFLHYDNWIDVLRQTYSFFLAVNNQYLEEQLDANKAHVVVTIIDVFHEFTDYVRRNNNEIVKEIQMALEIQNCQPPQVTNFLACNVVMNGNNSDAKPYVYDGGNESPLALPLWLSVNDCILGLFEMEDQYEDRRDKFALDLMALMWRARTLDAKKEVIERLKANIKDESWINDEYTHVHSKNVVFKSVNKIRDILPGYGFFVQLRSSVEEKKAKWQELRAQIARAERQPLVDYNDIREHEMEQKKAEHRQRRIRWEQEKARYHSTKQNGNVQMANRYIDVCKEYLSSKKEMAKLHNEEVRRREAHMAHINKTVIEPLEQQMNDKEAELRQLLEQFTLVQQKTGMEGYDEIKEFLEKMQGFVPLTMRICSRIMMFETLISTLSEMIVRAISVDIDDEIAIENGSFEIERIFNQYQLHIFVEPLKEKGLITMNDLVTAYKGKKRLFERELVPYLQRKIGRELRLPELWKIRRYCKVNE